MTGLPAWKHGQPGQVGNEAALTVVTSAGVRLVTYSCPFEDRPRGGLFVGASCVTVALSTTPRLVVLEVSDDGHGFNPQAPAGGLGLDSMRERAAAAGGRLAIRSSPKGTTVRMTVQPKAAR